MKLIRGSGYYHQIHDEYAIFEPGEEIEELTRELIMESTGHLRREYREPFGVIYLRWTRASVDLLAVREILRETLPNMVAGANVTQNPETIRMVEYEKTILDHFPIESFSSLAESVEWIQKVVREKRNGS